jgi:hypothetical protein
VTVQTIWLSCGVLRDELAELQRRGQIGGELRFLDSMLHMDPQELQIKLEVGLRRADLEGRRRVLVYGDCCGRMLDLARQFRAGRVDAINCAQMLVGRARYRELMRAQAFMLLPEWAPRWEEIMRSELGLTSEIAPDFMREQQRELVYLDTGLTPVPSAALAGCAAFTGLPLRVEAVTLDHLLTQLLAAEEAASVFLGSAGQS